MPNILGMNKPYLGWGKKEVSSDPGIYGTKSKQFNLKTVNGLVFRN